MGCRSSSHASAPQPGDSPESKAAVTVRQVVNKKPFTACYRLGKTLGSGAFSVVRQGTSLTNGAEVAVKCIKKRGLSTEDEVALQVEVAVMYELKHPNIVQFRDFFDEPTMYYLVTELMTGGELFDRIVEKEYYSEKEARDVVRTMAQAIAYCHEHNIVHRDLKPENILLTSSNDDATIKIADFGFAKKVEGGGLKTACGTPGYVAPEILEGGPYGLGVDLWSIGVITYILLCGYPPFHDENQTRLFRLIKNAQYEFDSPDWDNISDEAKDLIRKLLVVDPKRRLTCEQVLMHPWVAGKHVREVALTTTLGKLRQFNARRKWKGTLGAVRAGVRMQMMLRRPESADPTADVAAAASPPNSP